jgi:hypothetical protein
LLNNLNAYDKGQCGDRGGGNYTSDWKAYAWVIMGWPAYIPDYKTGLKDKSPEIYVPPPVIEPVPVLGPGRVPLRIPIRIPIFIP